jgi:hypothetical protein
MIDFSRILEDIPDWNHYLTVDELHQGNADIVNECPEKVDLISLGNSANGEIIDCLKIGEGKYNALIHGFPNCEEPFGGNLLDYLSRSLLNDDELIKQLDYTWYIIKCSDPDGARLNEGFQKGPHTPINFALNYYRTPNSMTPESCFPFKFGPLDLNNPVPETKALMKLMDRVPLHFVSSLHMMKWGGITFEVPYPSPELYTNLWDMAKRFNIFLRKRPGTTLAPGVMQAAYLTPARGYIKNWARGETNIEPIKGCYIYEYGQILNPNLFIMIPECCIWYDPSMWNDSATETTISESLSYAKRRDDEIDNSLIKLWKSAKPYLKTESPFKFMMEEWMEQILKKYTNISNPPFSFSSKMQARKATVAEKLGIEGRSDLYRMFHLGGLIRTIDVELNQGGSENLANLKEKVMSKLHEYNDYL